MNRSRSASPPRRGRRRALLAAALSCLAAGPARAWDPSRTHVQLTERAALSSDLHTRWMQASAGELGLFSQLRVDPALLDPSERLLLSQAIEAAPAETGSQPLGGPGACPSVTAPLETQRYCVEGDLWQLDALGWLRLGVFAEATPTYRLAHHFLDAEDPASTRWSDSSIPGPRTRRLQARSNGAPAASVFAGAGGHGEGASALGWIHDEADPLAPPRLAWHLERSATSATALEREHHMAMAMVCLGALTHVAQDLTVPAHARGDLAAFFAPRSTSPGDRGLGLQEWVRTRGWSHLLPLSSARSFQPDTSGGSLRERLAAVGAAAAGRFLSAGHLPRPTRLDLSLDEVQAAEVLLAQTKLMDTERTSARLRGWGQEDSGYLLSGTGRPLCAWRRHEDGTVHTFLDDTVYRDQAAHLIPVAQSVTAALMAALTPAWPAATELRAGILSFTLPDDLQHAEVIIATQGPDGTRGPMQRMEVAVGTPLRLVGVPQPTAARDTVVAFVGTDERDAPYVAARVFRWAASGEDE